MHLHETSKEAMVNYYGCPRCGHIFTIDKHDPTRITHVTPLHSAAGIGPNPDLADSVGALDSPGTACIHLL
jgi:hypothetical protein